MSEQTGEQVLEQVREALAREWAEHEDPALVALDGCVLLTAEEAKFVRGLLPSLQRFHDEGLVALGLLGGVLPDDCITVTERSPHKHGESDLFDPRPGDGYA